MTALLLSIWIAATAYGLIVLSQRVSKLEQQVAATNKAVVDLLKDQIERVSRNA